MFLKNARILRQPNKLLAKKYINLDIGNLCTLECPKCARQTQYKGIRPIPGHNMTVEEFTKIANYFTRMSFCGQISDPIFNPNLLEFVKIAKDKGRHLVIHTAATQKPMKWYEDVIEASGRVDWIFGIDGLPKDSHIYRVNQDGEKLWEVAKMCAKAGQKTTWQYIVFKYNENKIEEARGMAADHGLQFEVHHSSRWLGPNDPLRPTKEEWRLKR